MKAMKCSECGNDTVVNRTFVGECVFCKRCSTISLGEINRKFYHLMTDMLKYERDAPVAEIEK